MSSHAKGLLITGAAVLILTPDALLIRLVSADYWTLMFWRGLLTSLGIIIGLSCIYRHRTPVLFRQIGLTGLAVAACMALGTINFVTAVTHTTAASALFITSTAPLFAACMARWILKEPKPRPALPPEWASSAAPCLLSFVRVIA